MKKRLALDALMTVLIVLALLNQVTGQFAHEVIGTVLIVAVIVHLRLGWKTLEGVRAASAKEKGFGRNKQVVTVFCVLAVAVALLALSAVIISRVLMVAGSYLSDLDSGGGYIWSKIHVIAAYLFAICVVFHLVLHWSVVLRTLSGKKPPTAPPATNTNKVALAIAALVAVALAALCVRTLVVYANSSDSGSYQPSNGVTEQLKEAYSQDEASENSGAEGLGVYGAGDPRVKSSGSSSSDLGSPDEEASSFEDSSDTSNDSQSFIDAVTSATK